MVAYVGEWHRNREWRWGPGLHVVARLPPDEAGERLEPERGLEPSAGDAPKTPKPAGRSRSSLPSRMHRSPAQAAATSQLRDSAIKLHRPSVEIGLALLTRQVDVSHHRVVRRGVWWVGR